MKTKAKLAQTKGKNFVHKSHRKAEASQDNFSKKSSIYHF